MPEDIADVYRNTYPALVRFLYRKVWDAERAEDLAQEAFARALVHRPENARGWLFVVAANMARDEARKAARERRHLTLLKSEPDAVASTAEDEIDAETQRERVRTALEQLTPRDREA
ncbi:MAG TPA: sigma-70 family RNA polymerase sigma factor, partial [Gemmatimonadales bacterium]|nr:sigma-70 family RNA polymerase sigma factor [Gemmatimonadales bacterium]